MINSKINIAIFASGTGSNAQKIIDTFKENDKIKIALIVSNKDGAVVLEIAQRENVPSILIERKKFYEDGYADVLKEYNINWIVLAGFLWKIPPVLIEKYRDKIINIHPALLPKFGGKNMYGKYVHQAVLKSNETESGITIHFVDEIYDNGKIIFQAKCNVDENETTDTLATKIHELEHLHYPLIIKKLLSAGI